MPRPVVETAAVSRSSTPVDAIRQWFLHLDHRTASRVAWDRDFGHRLVISHLPDGLPTPPVAAWRVEPSGITVRSPHRVRDADAVEFHLPVSGDLLHIHVTVEAVRSRVATIEPRVYAQLRAEGCELPRSRRVRVNAGELSKWCVDSLGRNGFRVERMHQPVRRTATRRDARVQNSARRPAIMHLADIEAEVTVFDSGAAARAIAFGIGRGRAFGAGLIHISH